MEMITPEKLFTILSSQLRLEVLKILAEEPENVANVMKKLKARGVDIKYRETVYRALEKLVDVGLVGKFYDREKGLCYKLLVKSICVEITPDAIKIVC